MNTRIQRTLTLLLSGFFFGVALEKSKVYLPSVILSQMQYVDFTIFMSATATGMLIFGLLDLERHVDIDALGFNLMGGMGANIVGGLLVGAGMTITGACPGTNIVQIGAGVPNAIYTYFGQIVGALLFGVSFYYIQTVLPAYKRKRPALLLDRYFGMNFLTVSLMIASLIGFSLYLLEGYETYRKESLRYSRVLSYITSNKTYLQMVHWHPVVCGVLIGILQLFLTKYAGIQLGNSAQYVWLSSGIGKLILPQKAYEAYFKPTAQSPSSFSQAIQSIGCVLGAYVSAYKANLSILPEASHASPLQCFLGGIVLIFGARLAGGCPSGHGLTGVAKLGIGSISTVCGMFAGGGLVAYLFY